MRGCDDVVGLDVGLITHEFAPEILEEPKRHRRLRFRAMARGAGNGSGSAGSGSPWSFLSIIAILCLVGAVWSLVTGPTSK
jgi:hypothetical protein